MRRVSDRFQFLQLQRVSFKCVSFLITLVGLALTIVVSLNRMGFSQVCLVCDIFCMYICMCLGLVYVKERVLKAREMADDFVFDLNYAETRTSSRR